MSHVPCIAHSASATVVYPQPDSDVREYLTSVSPKTSSMAKARAKVFLNVLLRVASRYVGEMNPGTVYRSHEDLALAWRKYLESHTTSGATIRRLMYNEAIKVRYPPNHR